MMDWITQRIAISGYPSSKTDLRVVDSIVNLDKYTPYKTEVQSLHLPLIDGAGNAPDAVAEVVRRVDTLAQGGKVLVHCASGVSRSPYVLALYFTWRHDLFFDDAIELIARRRSRALNIDPGLLVDKDAVLSALRNGSVNGHHST
jgi:protein-tyrosine phosphatase